MEETVKITVVLKTSDTLTVVVDDVSREPVKVNFVIIDFNVLNDTIDITSPIQFWKSGLDPPLNKVVQL